MTKNLYIADNEHENKECFYRNVWEADLIDVDVGKYGFVKLQHYS